jgi:nicotinamide-nucleotide amidase
VTLPAIPGDAELARLVEALAQVLCGRGWTLATAESCTGGWIAKCCTDRAGSSTWFESGVVSYSDRAKRDLLGVDAGALERDGAVSRSVALQMAEGAARLRHAGGCAVTGIAGPDGGSEDKPVGTVWFGWAVGERPAECEVVVFAGGRDAVRRQTVAHALRGLWTGVMDPAYAVLAVAR